MPSVMHKSSANMVFMCLLPIRLSDDSIPSSPMLSSPNSSQIATPLMLLNDQVERSATMIVPRPDAAHDASRSAPTYC